MKGSTTNRLGKGISGLAVIGFVGTLVLGIAGAFPLLGKGALITIGISVAAFFLGLFIRVVGMVLMPLGGILILAAILQAILVKALGWHFFAFGLPDGRVGEMDLYIGLAGFGLVICGYFCVRTEEEEELAADAAAETRRRAQDQQDTVRASRATRTSCPNCGKEASGGMLAGNRITHCLSCGGTFCGRCATGGLLSRACPFCGENSQQKIRFGDTGTNW